MTRISIELVPRTISGLEDELRQLVTRFPAIDTVNIPDLLRFPIRSWQGCALARHYVPHAIPHIRAIDFSATEPFPYLEILQAAGLNELLIVSGDPPPADRPDTGATAVELIRLIKRAWPTVRIYAAIDPYRQGIQQEIAYAQAKRDAGADGFFTQPFFDLRLMEIFWEQLPDFNIYWGVSPVITTSSQRYWTSRNRAVFPSDFQPTMAWNQAFGRRALSFAQATGSDIYFMPIRADVCTYLAGILQLQPGIVPL